jgi:hypothetical protein
MKAYSTKAASTMLIVSGAIAIGAEPTISDAITDMAETISENYVFPDVGERVSESLLSSLNNGSYDGLSGRKLADTLQEQIRDLTHDLHFGVRALPPNWAPPTSEESDGRRPGPSAPYGFTSVERLDGNIGYIDLRGFNRASYIGETVEAAMQLIQGSSTVIIDLRRNSGGDPEAVQLISSYFFNPSESVHLNSLYSRPDDHTTEYWTHANIDTSLAMPQVPIYVLTSNRTFSAAEEFTYNLKNLERATIIGETTGGGAHPVDSYVFDNLFMVILPTARAINPISGTNWEGTGVSPDIETDADDALNVAMAQALEGAYERGDKSVRWGLATIRARLNPIQVSMKDLTEYAGDYGQRHVRISENALQYRRDGVSDWRNLVCFERDQFIIDGFDGFIMEFQRDNTGAIEGIAGLYQGGNTDFSDRDN